MMTSNLSILDFFKASVCLRHRFTFPPENFCNIIHKEAGEKLVASFHSSDDAFNSVFREKLVRTNKK